LGVSKAVVDHHITAWQAALERPRGYAYRSKWPRYLFRHERFENIVQILRSGELLSRNDAANRGFVDVAPADIIDVRLIAHDFVRLYFRPKNPTQYHIEGIRKANELYHGKHAPILFVMVFRAPALLCRTNTQFSDGNMQSTATDMGRDDAFFGTIRFDLVYHEGAFQHLDTVRARCAEVLIESPLQIDEALVAVLCRSAAERQTLLHACGRLTDALKNKIVVYREVGIFERRFANVETVSLGPTGLSFSLHPRVDSLPVSFEAEVKDDNLDTVVRTGPQLLDPSKSWIVRHEFAFGVYSINIRLEGEIGYAARAEIDDLPF
jgi:hypothetical protein